MTKETTKTTAVATKDDQAALPAEFEDAFLADEGAGQEGMDRDDFAIPRLAILQALSPQVQKQKPEHIPGAEPGAIIDTVSGALHDGEDGITVVPVSYRRAYIEWKLREDGGGFVADHGSDGAILGTCTRDDRGRDMTADGTQIVTTAEYFVYVVIGAGGEHQPAVISMSSTQLKKSRRWNTMINQFRLPRRDGGTFNPPMFSRAYHLTTVPENNDKGSWYGWVIKPSFVLSEVAVGMEIYNAAKDFREKVLSGEVKAAQPADDVGGAEDLDDDIPM